MTPMPPNPGTPPNSPDPAVPPTPSAPSITNLAAAPAPSTPDPGASRTRAGLAVMIGRTNAGKSTLLNALVGRKVSIVTPKPQTTRDPIHGVVTRPGGQIVFVDTTGIFQTAANPLVEKLHHKARHALKGIDIVLHVVDPSRDVGPEEQLVLDLLRAVTQPRLLVLTKADLPHRPALAHWHTRAAEYAATLEVSAFNGLNLEALVDAILRYLPEGPLLYPPDQTSNLTQTAWISEIIREKAYLLLGEEMPYYTRVEVATVEPRTTRDGRPLLAIKAALLTDNERRQRMLIGVGGRKIGEIGRTAREELEHWLGQKVFLDLAVLVDKHLFKHI